MEECLRRFRIALRLRVAALAEQGQRSKACCRQGIMDEWKNEFLKHKNHKQ